MTSAQHPHDGSDLADLRAEIDALKATPVEELVDPAPQSLLDAEGTPHPTESVGSAHWDEPDPSPATESED